MRHFTEDKTTNLIRMAAAHKGHGYIVVLHRDEAHRVAVRAREMGLGINYPVTFDEFLAGPHPGSFTDAYFIDNADDLLQVIAGPRARVLAISFDPVGDCP